MSRSWLFFLECYSLNIFFSAFFLFIKSELLLLISKIASKHIKILRIDERVFEKSIVQQIYFMMGE